MVETRMNIDSSLSSQFEQYLLSMNKDAASTLIRNEFSGDNALKLIREIIMPALRNIELKWKDGKIPLSHEYAVNSICERIVNLILPPESPERQIMPVLAITTLGEEFKLGKLIVISAMKACGFDIRDYGAMSVENTINKVREDKIKLILVSTKRLSSAYKVRDLRNGLDEEGIRSKIIVGGVPFLQDSELWEEVGADSMTSDATGAVFRVYDMMV
jgi:methanogenic corrinoid protein MtbC1